MIAALTTSRRMKLPEYDGFEISSGDGSTIGGLYPSMSFNIVNPLFGYTITLNLTLLHVNGNNQWDIFETGTSFSYTASNRTLATVGAYGMENIFNPDGPRPTTGFNTVYGFIYSGGVLEAGDFSEGISGAFSTDGPGVNGKLYEITRLIMGRPMKYAGTTVYNYG